MIFFFVSHCIFFLHHIFFKALKIKLATKAFSSIPNTKYVYLNVDVCECKWLRFLSMPGNRYLKLVVRFNVCDYLCRLTENGSTVRDFWLWYLTEKKKKSVFWEFFFLELRDEGIYSVRMLSNVNIESCNIVFVR